RWSSSAFSVRMISPRGFGGSAAKEADERETTSAAATTRITTASGEKGTRPSCGPTGWLTSCDPARPRAGTEQARTVGGSYWLNRNALLFTSAQMMFLYP